MPFEITPAQPGMPPVTPGVMPQYMQLRGDGVDLGAADANTINFVGMFATRGVGEQAGVVTVTAGGSSSVLAFSLFGSGDGTNTINTWTATPMLDNEAVGLWDGVEANELIFGGEGLYEVTVHSTVFCDPLLGTEFTIASALGGGDALTIGATHPTAVPNLNYAFTDVFLLLVEAGDLVRNFVAYTDDEVVQFDVTLSIVVRKLS